MTRDQLVLARGNEAIEPGELSAAPLVVDPMEDVEVIQFVLGMNVRRRGSPLSRNGLGALRIGLARSTQSRCAAARALGRADARAISDAAMATASGPLWQVRPAREDALDFPCYD